MEKGFAFHSTIHPNSHAALVAVGSLWPDLRTPELVAEWE
jgi:hypothetical protein